MSYYDDSSLFVAPNGYKASVLFAQKPMNANGQLAFTRSNDTATRVASNGLIERVRTNLILQSNTFSTTWTNSNSTETSGQAGYDGTNNAWLLSKSAASGYINQSVSLNGLQTFSVYAKAGTSNWVLLLITGNGVYFDLQNGVTGATSGITAKITSVGSGWYRCSISASVTNTVVRIYPAEADGVVSATSGNILIQSAQLETGDIATDYIATTTAARSVGPLANIPRIDYLGGGCGKLLLEPQRTNSLTYSEAFDNAAWSKTNLSVSANTTDTLDPSGYNGADKITDDTTNGAHQLVRFGIWSATQQTLSIFAKAGTSSKVFIQNGSTGQGAYFNLSTQSIVLSSGFTASIESYGNGWYRCIATHTASSSQTLLIGLFTGSSTTGYVGTGSYAYIWGAQIESGAYATSYVNTLAASVTRGADFAEKTSISSLVGGSEGTFFLELDYKPISSTTSALIYVGSLSNIIGFASSGTNTLRVRINAVNDIINSVNPSIRHKIAISFNASGVVCYVNGSSIALPNGASQVVSGLDTIGLNPSTRYNDLDVYQMLYFKTRLPNSELAALTTL